MDKKLILALALIIFSFGFIPTVKAAHVSCGTTLTTNTVLDSDLSCPSTALTIGTDNIELNCAGFTVTGNNTETGIKVNAANATIRNCRILGFQIGVDTSGQAVTTLLNNTIAASAISPARARAVLATSATYNITSNTLSASGGLTFTSRGIEGGRGTIEDNIIGGVRSISSTSSGIIVIGNSLFSAFGLGAAATVVNNTMPGNFNNSVVGASSLVENNTFNEFRRNFRDHGLQAALTD